MINRIKRFEQYSKLITEAKADDPEAGEVEMTPKKPKKPRKKRKKKDELEFVPIVGRTKNLTAKDALRAVHRMKRLEMPKRDDKKKA